MCRFKEFNTEGDYWVLCHYFTQQSFAIALQFDTSSILYIMELLIVFMYVLKC